MTSKEQILAAVDAYRDVSDMNYTEFVQRLNELRVLALSASADVVRELGDDMPRFTYVRDLRAPATLTPVAFYTSGASRYVCGDTEILRAEVVGSGVVAESSWTLRYSEHARVRRLLLSRLSWVTGGAEYGAVHQALARFAPYDLPTPGDQVRQGGHQNAEFVANLQHSRFQGVAAAMRAGASSLQIAHLLTERMPVWDAYTVVAYTTLSVQESISFGLCALRSLERHCLDQRSSAFAIALGRVTVLTAEVLATIERSTGLPETLP